MALNFSSRGECQQFRCNSLYLLPSTDNFISWTTRKSDEAGPSPHNILTRVCVRVICGFPKKVIENNCLDLIKNENK